MIVDLPVLERCYGYAHRGFRVPTTRATRFALASGSKIITALGILAERAAFVPAIDGYPQVFAPGERFSYTNGGYIVLAVIIDRLCDAGYHAYVADEVCARAGLTGTAFLRSDVATAPAQPCRRQPSSSTCSSNRSCGLLSCMSSTCSARRIR